MSAKFAQPNQRPERAGAKGRILSLILAVGMAMAFTHQAQACDLTLIETPGTAEGAVQITFAQAHEPSRRFPRTIVWLDQYSGAILATRDPRADGAGDVVLNWLHPIHAGELLGLPGRLALFATGLLPSVLLLTGWLRYRRRKRL